MRGIALIAALAVALGAGQAAAAPKPVEAMDLYRIAQVADPQVSPDGRQIAFLRETRNAMTDRVETELWLARADGGNARLAAGANLRPSAPRWSPTGDRIAFTGNAGEKAQIHVLNLGTGTAKPVSQLKERPRAVTWSPDGRRFAFVMRVEAKPAAFFALPPKPEGATWAADAKVLRAIPYRTDGEGWLKPGFMHVFVIDAEGASGPVQITSGDFDHGAEDARLAWTPDGAEVVFSADRRNDAEGSSNQENLYAVAVETGALRQLTSAKGFETNPAISPDGRMLAFVGWADRPTSYQQSAIFVQPLAGGAARNLTESLDRRAVQPQWDAQGRLTFLFEDKGVNRIGRVGADGAKVETLAALVGNTRLLLPSSGGGTYTCAAGLCAYPTVEVDRPPALGVLKGARAHAVLDLNADWRKEKAIGKLEELWAPSKADGRKIHGWALYPPDFDPTKKYPLALDIHGGPHIDYGPMFSITHHLYAAAGFVVLFANPRGSVGYGEEFANLINKAYPGNDHDDLMSMVDAMVAKGFVDERNLFIGGGSGGGVLTAWAIGKTDRFRAASVKRPVINWTSTALTSDIGGYMSSYWFEKRPWEEPDTYWRRSPLSLVGNVKTPTVIITGENDFRTPMSDSEQYFQALRLNGVDAALVRLADANHGFGRPSQWLTAIEATIGWYKAHAAQ